MSKFVNFSYESSRQPAESQTVSPDVLPLFDIEEINQQPIPLETPDVPETLQKPRIAPDHPSMHHHTYDYSEGETAYTSLGGGKSEYESRIESMRAMVAANMASEVVRRQVELIDQAEYAASAKENISEIRRQKRELDARNGIDVDSPAYLANERVEALRRSQRAK